jgi:hypothetical protein
MPCGPDNTRSQCNCYYRIDYYENYDHFSGTVELLVEIVVAQHGLSSWWIAGWIDG